MVDAPLAGRLLRFPLKVGDRVTRSSSSIVLLAATVITGMVVCGGKHHDGLLADVVSAQAAESLEDVHNVLANVTLAFVLAHIATVLVAALARPHAGCRCFRC